MTSATEIARASVIAEQNAIIAAAYDALIEARNRSRADLPRVLAAIEQIEEWRQKRDPRRSAS